MKDDQRITPTSLLVEMGVTPADNPFALKTALPWKSMAGGMQTRTLFEYQRFLEEIGGKYQLFGPLAAAASLQSILFKRFITDPIKAHARIAVRAGKEPDIYRDMNGWIYKNYARSLYDLCSYFINDGKFDRKKAVTVSTTPEGHRMLKEYCQEFARMEMLYNSLGMTRLHAMKEMLKCLLVVVTELPLDGEDLPYMRKQKDGTDAMTFEEYLEENRFRLECLQKANAFDPKEFSERATQGRIGCSEYVVVKGSSLHSVSLRHYPLPEGVEPNGRVLYISTPLINKPELFDLADGKSVVQGMLREGYAIYLVDYGECGSDDTNLGLDFYAKTIHDRYLEIVKKKHPDCEIQVMGYCMGGTLMLPYLARRVEERAARGEDMDIPQDRPDGVARPFRRHRQRPRTDALIHPAALRSRPYKRAVRQRQRPPPDRRFRHERDPAGGPLHGPQRFLRPRHLLARHRGLGALPLLADPRNEVSNSCTSRMDIPLLSRQRTGEGNVSPALDGPGTRRPARGHESPWPGEASSYSTTGLPRPHRSARLLRRQPVVGDPRRRKHPDDPRRA